MSAVIQHHTNTAGGTTVLAHGHAGRTIAFGPGGPVLLGTFLQQVRSLAAMLPNGRHAINLCEDRYRFLVAFCAVALR